MSTFRANLDSDIGPAKLRAPELPINPRSHIAVFIRALDGGGAQRDAILLANAISEAGVDVSILTLVPEGKLRRLVSARVLVHDIGAKRLAASVPALRRSIKHLRPDVLFSSEAAANLVAFAAVRLLPKKAQPQLVLREVTAPSIAKKLDPYFQNRLAFQAIGHAYARADRVLTLTDGARRDLIENFGVPAERITVMTSNAVIDPSTVERLRDQTHERPSRQKALLVAIGRLSPEKDHLTLLEAVADLRWRMPVQLVIVGEGPERPDLENAIAYLGLANDVTLAGPTDDPFAWLLDADVVVSSSKFEGLGNVLIEAMACGTPVVSTDCPYGPREILDGGRLGELVPVGDAKALSTAIERTLKRTIDRASLKQVAERYTASNAATFLITNLGLA